MRPLLLAMVPFLVAAAPASSVKVRILALEDLPAPMHRTPLAVRVSIGGVHLYTTPYVTGAAPRWNKSLRASTAANSPIIFEVLGEGQAAAERGDALSTGFEELVGDYDDQPDRPQKLAHRVLCRAELAWLPKDGAHRLKCGEMVLVVRTARLK